MQAQMTPNPFVDELQRYVSSRLAALDLLKDTETGSVDPSEAHRRLTRRAEDAVQIDRQADARAVR